jgi:hypothetical protein
MNLIAHFLCSVDRASLYNLVNKTNLVWYAGCTLRMHPAYQTVIHTE